MGLIRQTSIVPEYLAKAASIPAGILALGSEGNVLEKMVSGATKLWTGPVGALKNYGVLSEVSGDYDGLTTREFVNKYGADTGNYLMEQFQGVVDFGKQFGENFQDQSIETVGAAAGILALLYGAGRYIKYWRQKGQGSSLDQWERKKGARRWPEVDKK
jgi:hypothetical protein